MEVLPDTFEENLLCEKKHCPSEKTSPFRRNSSGNSNELQWLNVMLTSPKRANNSKKNIFRIFEMKDKPHFEHFLFFSKLFRTRKNFLKYLCFKQYSVFPVRGAVWVYRLILFFVWAFSVIGYVLYETKSAFFSIAKKLWSEEPSLTRSKSFNFHTID